MLLLVLVLVVLFLFLLLHLMLIEASAYAHGQISPLNASMVLYLRGFCLGKSSGNPWAKLVLHF
jgi:hypothetical protein